MAVNPRSSTPARALPTQGGAKELPPAGATGRGLERVARVINPGGWAVESERPIATLLGSCVAVCLIDPQLHLAGMNHFLLPSGQPGGSRRSTDEDTVLHGDYAMEVLRNAMYARGASPARLIAKAFGGGNVVNAIQMAIGSRNAEFAREWLQREGIPLLSSDLGGRGRARWCSTPSRAMRFAAAQPSTAPRRLPWPMQRMPTKKLCSNVLLPLLRRKRKSSCSSAAVHAVVASPCWCCVHCALAALGAAAVAGVVVGGSGGGVGGLGVAPGRARRCAPRAPAPGL